MDGHSKYGGEYRIRKLKKANLDFGVRRRALLWLRRLPEVPVKTGWEFRAGQQQQSTLREIPVIVMSALPDLDRRAVALEVAGCLNKPIDINVLLDMITQYYQLAAELFDSQLTANRMDRRERDGQLWSACS